MQSQLSAGRYDALEEFVKKSRFESSGALFTDLDGTAIHEDRGRIFIPREVRDGMKAIHDIGRPVVMNTLRFPLSVIRTVGLEWYEISNKPIPTVLLNGSVLGNIHRNPLGILVYEEVAAFPLEDEEIDAVIEGVRALVAGGIRDLVVFYYPRAWIEGEMVWTPNEEKVPEIEAKFVSSTRVVAWEIERLAEEAKRARPCMMFLLINESEDRLMAYQHSKSSNFFTHAGVDKTSGMRELARLLDISLVDSIGAGDTVMDRFLSDVGFSLAVGGANLPHKGKFGNLRLENSFDLGRALAHVFGHRAQTPVNG